MAKISLNTSLNLAELERVEIESASQLADLITQSNYTTIVYHEDYRLEDNFESAEIIGLDFDDGTPTLEEAKNIFADYKHVIATTKSHQKEKTGKPACDRFRVLLWFSRPVTTVAEYRATWLHLNASIAGLDKQAKDAARLWYKSKDIVSVMETGQLVDPVEPQVTEQPTQASQLAGLANDDIKGKLANSTLRLLHEGAQPGKRNTSYHKAARDMHQNRYDDGEIREKLKAAPRDPDFTDEEIDRIVDSATGKPARHAPRIDPNATLKKYISEGKYMVEMATNDGLLYVEKQGIILKVSEKTLRDILGAEGLTHYKATHFIHCVFKYAPFSNRVLSVDPKTKSVIFNSYNPPDWQREHYFFNANLPAKHDLPSVYREFFNHLCDNDQDSVEYVLDWLSTAVKRRNYTILTAIGIEGAGKGVFAEIMACIFGEDNYTKVRDDIFKGRFNSQFKNKRLVFLDEVEVRTSEQYNRLKDIVNDKIEVESKGVDAEYIDNCASFFLASNDLNAIRPSATDRRFSVIQVSNVKLKDTPLVSRIDSEMKDPKNIEQLVGFLLHRDVTRDMLTPFRSQRYAEVMEASLSEWELYVIEEWTAANLNKAVPIREVQEDIVSKLNMKHAPGRQRFEELAAKFPQYLRYKKKNYGSVRTLEAVGTPIKADEPPSAPKIPTSLQNLPSISKQGRA